MAGAVKARQGDGDAPTSARRQSRAGRWREPDESAKPILHRAGFRDRASAPPQKPGNVAKLGMKNGLQLNVPSSYDFA